MYIGIGLVLAHILVILYTILTIFHKRFRQFLYEDVFGGTFYGEFLEGLTSISIDDFDEDDLFGEVLSLSVGFLFGVFVHLLICLVIFIIGLLLYPIVVGIIIFYFLVKRKIKNR